MHATTHYLQSDFVCNAWQTSSYLSQYDAELPAISAFLPEAPANDL